MMVHHIEVHRFLRDQELERAGNPERLSWDGAVASWFDTVYMPVVEAIRDYELLHNFPGRTEADLYLWIALHRERLAAAYGLAPLSPTRGGLYLCAGLWRYIDPAYGEGVAQGTTLGFG